MSDKRANQCQRVLERLERGPATTADLVIGLRIMSLTKRVSELRRQGHNIVTSEQWTNGTRIVTYSLMGQMKLIA